MTENTRRALDITGDSFRQFSRNGRWGTCVDCPKTADGHAVPEACVNTHRYDHRLDVVALAENWQRQTAWRSGFTD